MTAAGATRPAVCLPLAAAILAGIGLPALADLPTRPLGAVRSLHHIQDQIARGDPSAFQLQSSTLRVIDELFASLDADALADPAERRAVLAYAVSGGNPATFARLYDTLARQSDEDERRSPPRLPERCWTNRSATRRPPARWCSAACSAPVLP